MEEILNILAWAEHPLLECAGAKVIMNENFAPTSEKIADLTNVYKTKEEIELLFREQAKRFSACGANNTEKYAVLRKNFQNGWIYFAKLILDEDA